MNFLPPPLGTGGGDPGAMMGGTVLSNTTPRGPEQQGCHGSEAGPARLAVICAAAVGGRPIEATPHIPEGGHALG